MTSVAIQDAFLQLLLEKGFDDISMRDIATVSGVSIGGLYRYFPNKEAIAAMTIRSCVRRLKAALEQAVVDDGLTLDRRIERFAQAHVNVAWRSAASWRVLGPLTRRLTPPAVYNRLYLEHVALLQTALTTAPDWPTGRSGFSEAFNAFTMMDALVNQTLVVRTEWPSEAAMVSDIVAAVNGYLRLALSEAPRLP